ncbi:MAG: hypothetical protein RBQ99_02840 [Trichlorobacter sp.]|nr:hypothetical protein [Trichlorobacter sp.]
MKAMEAEKLICEWVELCQKGNEFFNKAGELFGDAKDAPLLGHIAQQASFIGRLISERIGDTQDWLDWFFVECQLGDKPLYVLVAGEGEILVKTPKDLVRVIKSTCWAESNLAEQVMAGAARA